MSPFRRELTRIKFSRNTPLVLQGNYLQWILKKKAKGLKGFGIIFGRVHTRTVFFEERIRNSLLDFDA